jgi:DNA (cytosine-5)-methyltransferase 1
MEDVPLDDVLAPCYVLHKDLVWDMNLWVNLGAEYFYYRYHFSQRSPASWNEREVLAENAGVGCKICAYELQAHIADVVTFAEEAQTRKLRAFDIFAGAGAMSLGMENATGGMRTTHAVEISPSAARTFRYAHKGLPRGETGDLYGRTSNSGVFFLGATRPIRLCTTSA